MKIHHNCVGLVVVIALATASCQSAMTTGTKVRIQSGDYEGAVQLANVAIDENPDDSEAYFYLGLAYSHLDRVADAYDAFMAAIELRPNDRGLRDDVENNVRHNFAKHYNRGRLEYRKGNYEAAVGELRLATEADPREPSGFYNLGIAYSGLADEDPAYTALAIEAIDCVFERDPDEALRIDALEAAGAVLASAGREEEALERFHVLLQQDPQRYDAVEQVADDLLVREEWRKAVAFLELAADARSKTGNDDPSTYSVIGAVWYRLRDDDPNAVASAVQHLQKALDLQPDEPQTVLNLMGAYAFQKDWVQAIHWGEKYVRLEPEDPTGWRLLARCYSEAGDPERARRCLERIE